MLRVRAWQTPTQRWPRHHNRGGPILSAGKAVIRDMHDALLPGLSLATEKPDKGAFMSSH